MRVSLGNCASLSWMLAMSAKEDARKFTIDGSVYRDKPASVQLTRFLHRVLPLSLQRSFRDGAFRRVADGGAVVSAAVTAVLRPHLLARFVAVTRRKEDHRYGPHPRQVIEVVKGCEESTIKGSSAGSGKLLVFVHGGAWGSGSTWMYRVMVDRLAKVGYTVANIGYRVYPDGDTDAQVDDLAAAMKWMSANLDLLGYDMDGVDGFEPKDYPTKSATMRSRERSRSTRLPSTVNADTESDGAGTNEDAGVAGDVQNSRGRKGGAPEVYLMGHSSGAHISLLYLIRRAERERDTALRKHEIGRFWEAMPGSERATEDLEVEGLIGLAGVYDIYRHYLYESWRGVHEISPMKASHGGLLHTLFDYSHPFLLGGKARGPPPPSMSPHDNVPLGSTEDTPPESDASRSDALEKELEESTAAAMKELQRTSDDGQNGPDAADDEKGNLVWDDRLRLGLKLPRTLLWHGTADVTVPFSQTTEAAAALRAIGVNITTCFAHGGHHFDPVGQLMFSEDSVVEQAINSFTAAGPSEEAKRRQEHSSLFARSKL